MLSIGDCPALPVNAFKRESEMRKSLAAILLLCCSQAVAAERVSRAEFMVLCEDHSLLARAIMQGRQQGAPIADTMALAKGDRAVKKMVEVAYRTDQGETDKARSRAVSDFENAVYAGCMNGAPRR